MSPKSFRLLILFAVLFFPGFASGQNDDHLKARTYMKYKDYNRALEQYLQLYEKDKENTEVNYNLGLCYLNINSDKTKAIPFLEYVLTKEQPPKDIFLYLGTAYMYAYRFEEAIDYFNKAKSANRKKEDIAEALIKNCENAKILIKNPVNVTFTNLGPLVNSSFPDYVPFVTADHKTLYFTSTREKNKRKKKSSEGFFTSDIYFTNGDKKTWNKAESIGNNINTVEDELCVSITPSGKNMVIYIDNAESIGDLYISTTAKKGQFSKPIHMSKPVNTKRPEMEGYITEDEKTMFVSSKRKFGFGETDIYMFKKQEDGTWGKGENLGEAINTEYKESFPVYDEKEGALYFASQGHINMGGFDIFKSKYDSVLKVFEPAVNIGYPINTPEDNMQISFPKNRRYGYISAYKEDGLGDLDIYKVTFNNIKDEDEIKENKLAKFDTVIYIYIRDTVTINNNKETAISNELVYRVQIGVYQNAVPKDAFKGMSAIYAEPSVGGTKYFVGAFSDFENAIRARDFIRTQGIKDAFIVAFYNKKRITIEEAKSYENKRNAPLIPK